MSTAEAETPGRLVRITLPLDVVISHPITISILFAQG